MKNFEESLRQLNAPDLQVTAFRHKLRHDLSAAQAALSIRRWRRACMATGTLAVVLAIALMGFVTTPTVATPGSTGSVEAWLAVNEITIQDDRDFLDAYHARQASDVRIRSIDEERLVAIREFTMSDGRQMVVYTEVGDGRSTRSEVPVNDRLAMLASQASTTF